MSATENQMHCSNYEAAKAAIKECVEWADAGFPGAILEDLAAMTSMEPEWNAARARLRAERNVDLILRGCWEIHEELEAVGMPAEYRQAVYMERMGVKRGRAAFKLMESPE